MDEDQWMYEGIMPEEVNMDYENEEECGVNEPHVDCSDAFNTFQVFNSREDLLQWARSVAYENGFVAVIVRSDTNTGSRGNTSFVLIGCERSGEYRCRKKEFVRRDTGTRKCGCPFKLRGKPVVGGQGWMVKLICGIHNHELAKSLVGHPYAGRLTKDEKTLIVDMTKSMVKPRNILLTLKEHNANSYSTYKTNRYKLSLLDFVEVTPTGMTFSAGFAYLKSENLNNVVWPLECFRGTLVDCPSEQQFDECLKRFEMVCSPWPMFVDYVKDTWIIPHKEKFVTAWTNKKTISSSLVAQTDLRMSLHVDGLTTIYLKDRCPLSPITLLWSSNCHLQAKQWPTPYISRMQHYRSFAMYKRDYVDLNDD
ncbi:hypothetical protein HKD37_12G034652 [Glycine soja]